MSVRRKGEAEGTPSLLEFQFDAVDQSALTFVLSDGPSGLSVAVIDERSSQNDPPAQLDSVTASGAGGQQSLGDSAPKTVTVPASITPVESEPVTTRPKVFTQSETQSETPPKARPQASPPTTQGSSAVDNRSESSPKGRGPGELALTLDELNGSSTGSVQSAIAVLSLAGIALAVGDQRRRIFNNRR
jgi:hypothetical protein